MQLISGERLQDHWSSGIQVCDSVIFSYECNCFYMRTPCLKYLHPKRKVEQLASISIQFTYEPHREKTGLLPMRKQRRRSASQ